VRRDRGFTLVEILIAIVLVGILTAVVVVGVGSLTSTGQAASCATSLDAARVAATAHTVSTGTAPATFTDLVTSGALSLASGVSVDTGGRRIVGNGWQLVMQTANPLQLACATGTSTLPLDSTTTPATAAYSLRRVSAAYTGPAIQVRRSSDNATLDIGFTAAGDLDTATLTTFVGAASGFVTTWYDQSGNGRHATQGTAANQPRIVNAGTIDTSAGRPALYGAGVAFLRLPAEVRTTDFTTNLVFRKTADSVDAVMIGGLTWSQLWRVDPTAKPHTFFGVDVVSTPTFSLASPASVSFVRAGTAVRPYLNGTAGGVMTQNTAAASFVRIGAIVAADSSEWPYWTGWASELVVYTTALGMTERQALERDQGAYYGIAVA
jgi:prepilin-type N-terminal cleavage/methylation domain-containing protein